MLNIECEDSDHQDEFMCLQKQPAVDSSPIKMLLSPMVWPKHRNGLNTEPVLWSRLW